MNASPSDRMYDCLPMYHSVGGVVATSALLARGGSVLIRDRFSLRHFWDDVCAGDCTMFQYIGELCRYLLNAPEHPRDRAHRLRLCCGNGLQADIWKRFQDRFAVPRILEFYASTEGNVSLYNVEGKIGSIGRVPPFLASRFALALVQFDPATGRPARGEHGFCIRCGVNEIGEALGRIPSEGAQGGESFEGYTDSKDTEQKILHDVFARGDRWFRTGDLMRMDAGGFYYFVDRIGDTFRWKGENVDLGSRHRRHGVCRHHRSQRLRREGSGRRRRRRHGRDRAGRHPGYRSAARASPVAAPALRAAEIPARGEAACDHHDFQAHQGRFAARRLRSGGEQRRDLFRRSGE
jgi:fatty-acyl-CoA synthase